MRCLALETSTRHFSLAVFSEEKVLRYRTVRLKGFLSSSIMPAVRNILKSAGCLPKDLDVLSVGLGPGSFTSLRVGCATVKGLAFGWNVPVVGIGSLDILAMPMADEPHPMILTMTDARRQSVYAALYKAAAPVPQRVWGPALVKPAEALAQVKSRTICVGDGVSLYNKDIQTMAKKMPCGLVVLDKDDPRHFPQARVMRKAVWERYKRKAFDDAAQLVPNYLYPEDCQVTRPNKT